MKFKIIIRNSAKSFGRTFCMVVWMTHICNINSRRFLCVKIYMNKKLCCGCREEKDFDCFSKSKTGKFGLHNHCKNCCKIRKDEWYKSNLDKVKCYENNPVNKDRKR